SAGSLLLWPISAIAGITVRCDVISAWVGAAGRFCGGLLAPNRHSGAQAGRCRPDISSRRLPGNPIHFFLHVLFLKTGALQDTLPVLDHLRMPAQIRDAIA